MGGSVSGGDGARARGSGPASTVVPAICQAPWEPCVRAGSRASREGEKAPRWSAYSPGGAPAQVGKVVRKANTSPGRHWLDG